MALGELVTPSTKLFAGSGRLRTAVLYKRLVVLSLLLTDMTISTLRAMVYMNTGVPATDFGPLKFLDPALVIGLSILQLMTVLLRQRGRLTRWMIFWLLGCAGFLGWGILNVLFYHPPLYDALQSLFVFIRPLLLFFIFASLDLDPEDYRTLLKPVIAWGILSALVAIYQCVINQFRIGDTIWGLLLDAHHQAIFSYSLALLLLGDRSIIPWRWLRLAVISLLFVIAFIAINAKATGALILLLGVTYLASRFSRRQILGFMLFIPILLLVGAYIVFGSNAWVARLRYALTGGLPNILQDYQGRSIVNDIGVYQMSRYYLTQTALDPLVGAIGLGLSNYGSPAMLSRLRRGGGELWQRQFFAFDYYALPPDELLLHGLSYRSSLYGTILGETGFVGFSIWFFLASLPLAFRLPASPAQRRRTFWVRLAYLMILLSAVVTWSGSWDVDLATLVVMMGLAVSWTEAFHRPKPARFTANLEHSTYA
jgi:hypothetical protein